MVAAYHLIWAIYGAWLPNDPRGRRSEEIRSEMLKALGEIHFGRKKIQPNSSVIRKFYRAAKPLLKFDSIPFTDDEIAVIAQAIAETIKTRGYTCYGCAIMPDHMHLLIRKHRDKAEEMIGYFQDDSFLRLQELKRWPSDHPIWGGPGWKVFLNTRVDIERTVRYIGDNPIKAGRAEQIWDFVMKYDGWLPGIGARK